MAAVNQDIVREYFEMHGFLVRQDRKYIMRGRMEEDGIDFFVFNPKKREKPVELPFVLTSRDVQAVERALVVVRGWHTEVFSAAVLHNAPDIFGFVKPSVLKQAVQSYGLDSEPMKILVVPALPTGTDAKEESIKVLRQKGVDAVIPFRTILTDLVANIETNRNYDKSDVLQVIRVLLQTFQGAADGVVQTPENAEEKEGFRRAGNRLGIILVCTKLIGAHDPGHRQLRFVYLQPRPVLGRDEGGPPGASQRRDHVG